MKKNGFTLVELLCVIVIVSVLAIVTLPLITNNLKANKNSIYDSIINKILNATTSWALENTNSLPDEGEEIKITLGLLQSAGLISTDLKNPKTDALFPADMTITIQYVKSSKDNEKLKYSTYDGNYLFRVNVDTGTEIKDIKDEYTIIELASTIEEVDKIVYQDKDGNVLSLKEVSTQIVSNGLNVSEIDTKKLGIYYVYYTYNDSKKSFVRVFNVVDTKLPEITFPVDDIVSYNVSSFDLYENVICTDNSGKCDLKITEGEQDFYEALSSKKEGIYVVSYTGSDASLNTVVKKRVIEIIE